MYWRQEHAREGRRKRGRGDGGGTRSREIQGMFDLNTNMRSHDFEVRVPDLSKIKNQAVCAH